MKKLLIALGIGTMMLGAVSCSKSGGDSADGAFADSLSTSIGQIQGMRIGSEFNSLPEEQRAQLNKQEILDGFKHVIMLDTTKQSYISGLNLGMQLSGMLYRYEQAGIKVDRKKIYDAYSKAFLADSVDTEALRVAQEQFQALSTQAQEKMMEYYRKQEEAAKAAKENAPEAKENLKKGQDYIKALQAKDKDIKVTPSGLAYKILTPGSGPAVGQGGSATVKYKGSLIDGKVFDENKEGVQMSTMGVIPGFGEGLAMLNKGAKYILYIPGNLAYGIDGAPQAGIGPNATLIFEVEAVDVTPAN